jgi:hypothetical protein
VLPGLDEFMLRTGHLRVLCEAATDTGRGARNVQSEVQSLIEKPTRVPEANLRNVGKYLAAKKLCRVRDDKCSSSYEEGKEYKYPELEVRSERDGSYTVLASAGQAVEIEWQDGCIADECVTSKVGALARAGKSGSKTGVSHIFDWAQLLDLVDSSGQATPMGRMCSSADRLFAGRTSPNPYRFGASTLVIAHQYFARDFDLFARLASLLVKEGRPLTKSIARELYASALERLCADLEASSSTLGTASFAVFQQMRDLERAARRAKSNPGQTSTAWHRAASRLESLVDFGILSKGSSGADSQYQYVYFATDALRVAVETARASLSADEWIGDHLLSLLFPQFPAAPAAADEVSPTDVDEVVAALALPTTLIPIDALVLGLACISLRRGMATPLGTLRRSVEDLPTVFPGRARLSRGSSGSRAEYISWQVRHSAI